MIRRLAILVMAMALAVTMLAPAAFAASGTAHCGGGGYGYTSTSVDGWRIHRFAGEEADVKGPTTVNHGYFTGSRPWSISGSGPGNGYCVT